MLVSILSFGIMITNRDLKGIYFQFWKAKAEYRDNIMIFKSKFQIIT